MNLTAYRILTSDGKTPQRAEHATPQHKQNASVLCERANALLAELMVLSVNVNDGFRDASVSYGAAHSAHKEGQAVDLKDSNQALSKRITRELLLKHKLRREDNDYTKTWCHLDIRQPWGSIFKP